jgi:hypothetical protein
LGSAAGSRRRERAEGRPLSNVSPSPTAEAGSRRRLVLLGGALAVAAAALIAQLVSSPGRFAALPLYDFAEYWAAGRLNAAGENPYDPELIDRLEREAGRDCEALLMWNPPWTLTLVMPFGLLDGRPARLLWLLLHFALLLWSADAAWRLYGGPADRRRVAWSLAFAFVPAFLTLYLGQISVLLLAGAVLFLRLEQRGREWAAGAATLLLAVKPHLVFLFWPALLLWAADRRRWRVLAGAALAGLAATAVPLVCNPHVLGQYWETLTARPPAQYYSPTLGTLLRLAFGESRFGLQFLPPLAGLAWFAVMWRQHRAAWDWADRLPVLLLVSMLTAPYGAWPFDVVVLLVPLLRVATAVARNPRPAPARLGLALYFAFNAAGALLLAYRVDFLWWVWMTPALLMSYVVMRRVLRVAGRAGTGLPASVAAAPAPSVP